MTYTRYLTAFFAFILSLSLIFFTFSQRRQGFIYLLSELIKLSWLYDKNAISSSCIFLNLQVKSVYLDCYELITDFSKALHPQPSKSDDVLKLLRFL